MDAAEVDLRENSGCWGKHSPVRLVQQRDNRSAGPIWDATVWRGQWRQPYDGRSLAADIAPRSLTLLDH